MQTKSHMINIHNAGKKPIIWFTMRKERGNYRNSEHSEITIKPM